jgi:hypothetical protein
LAYFNQGIRGVPMFIIAIAPILGRWSPQYQETPAHPEIMATLLPQIQNQSRCGFSTEREIHNQEFFHCCAQERSFAKSISPKVELRM